VAPICCVIPPASPSCTWVLRSLSKIFVFPAAQIIHTVNPRTKYFLQALPAKNWDINYKPVSTWPSTQTTGARSCSRLRAFSLASRRFYESNKKSNSVSQVQEKEQGAIGICIWF
jgi:hypothetical protein